MNSIGGFRKTLIVCSSEALARTQLSKDRLHVLDGAAHPLQFGVRKLLPD